LINRRYYLIAKRKSMNGVEHKRQIETFIENGFLKIEDAFSAGCAKECVNILWKDLGCQPADPSSWTKQVVWLGYYSQPPFIQAANTPKLHKAFNQLAGLGNWKTPETLGTFPVRFPGTADTGDIGWHIDVSFANDSTEPNNFLTWRANINSKGRALLMLFLFSDIGPDDAPTRIRAGSHLDIAQRLSAAGEDGLSLLELAGNNFSESEGTEEVLATGAAGTVYLCHPFLVHAAGINRGKSPRFLAQPALLPKRPYNLNRADSNYTPVEIAIRKGLGLNPIYA
jgi:hypothetical protein